MFTDMFIDLTARSTDINYIPMAGEVVWLSDTGKLVIGDGTSCIQNLTPIGTTEHVSDVKKFIEDNINLIENYEFDILYNKLKTNLLLLHEFVIMMAEIDIDVAEYSDKFSKYVGKII